MMASIHTLDGLPRHQVLAEVPSLEEQLSKSELLAAARRLDACLTASWLCVAGEALRRWVYYASSGPEPNFPFRRTLQVRGWPLMTFPCMRMLTTALEPNCPFRRTLHTLHSAQERRDERDKPPVTSPSLSPPPRAPPSTRASLPPPPSHALGTALALQPVPERQALSTTLSSASAMGAQYGAQPGGASAFAAANSAFAAATANGGGAGAGGLKATTVEAAGRRTARLLELQRVVWLSPFGGGSCLRVLWAWRETARLLGAKVRDETLRFDLDSTSIPSRSTHGGPECA